MTQILTAILFLVFVKCSGVSGTTQNGYIEDCSQLACPEVDGNQPVYAPLLNCIQFCQCSNGIAYTQDCATGLQFNPSLNVCDWPANVGCTGSSNSNSDNTDNNDKTNGNNENEKNDSNSDANKSSDACINSGIECPAVDSQDSVYGALANCSQFCQCSNGKPYLHECPAGLHFNPTLNVCDWPYNAGCKGNGNSSNGNNSNNCSCNNSTKTGDVCLDSGLVCPVVDGEYPVYGALPNCSQFCQCSNGIPYLYDCPSGLHFNPSLNVCDWPYRAGCTGTNSSNSGTNSGKSNTGCNCNNSITTGDVCLDSGIECPIIDGDYPVYGALSNLSQFCQCSNGKPYLHECPAGLQFNTTLNVCAWPSNSGISEDEYNDDDDDGYDCEESPFETYSLNLGFDLPKILDNTDCAGINCPDIAGDYTIYAPAVNCSQFCKCSNGVVKVVNCPAGSHFNQELNICDLAENVKCL